MMPCPVKCCLIFTRNIPGRAPEVLLLLLFSLIIKTAAYAQCTRQERFYAGTQAFTGNVANDARTVDNDPVTFSTLSAALLSSATQYLTFSQSITAGTPVTVKLSPPSGALNLLASMTLQAYTVNPVTGVRTNAGVAIGNTTLLGLLSSSGSMEVTFIPQTAGGVPVAYQGVAVTLGGLTVTIVRMNLYHAFVMKDATGDMACNGVVDFLSGVKTTGLDLATSLSKVISEEKAGDDDLVSYANMQADVGLLNPLYETVIFQTPSVAGDSIRIVLKDPAVPLLSLSALGGFSIQPYLGQTAAGSPLTNTSPLVNLQLLSGGTGQQYVLTAPVAGPFDRVEILLTGLAGVLRNLYIYDVRRIAKEPAFNFTVSGQPATQPVCITKVNSVLYTITAAEACATYRWYNGNDVLLSSGATFTPAITTAGSYTYYVAAQRTGCSNIETKKQLSINVSALPGAPTLTIETNP